MAGASTLGAAIVGAGQWAPRHVEAIRRTGIGEVICLVGRDLMNVRASAAHLGIDLASVDLAGVLENPDVDIIHICTPNDSHARLALAAVGAGKHVVVEKPIALSGTEAREVAAAASTARVHGMTAFTYRGFTTLRRARTLVYEGALGSIRMVAGYFLQDWLTRPSANWRLDQNRGGPSLTVADIGVHWFDAVEFISAQRVIQVIATLAINRAAAQWGEDTAAVLLKFDNDASGTALLSQAFPGLTNAMRIDLAGEVSSLKWELGPFGAVLEGGDVGQQYAKHDEDAIDALTNLFNPFYRAVLLRQSPLAMEGLDYPTLWDGYRAAQFVDAVLESSRTQRWASLDRPDR